MVNSWVQITLGRGYLSLSQINRDNRPCADLTFYLYFTIMLPDNCLTDAHSQANTTAASRAGFINPVEAVKYFAQFLTMHAHAVILYL